MLLGVSMKYRLIVILLLLWVALSAQSITKDKVTLKTGDVFIGNIVLQNDEIVMLTDLKGVRYQFPVAEIKSIEKIEERAAGSDTMNVSSYKQAVQGNVCGLLELSGAFGSADNRFSYRPMGQASLTFGSRQISGKSIFVGAGVGYLAVAESESQDLVSFVPLYVRLKSVFTQKETAPYAFVDAGYSFALNTEFKGGLYAKTGVGFQYNAMSKTSFYWGVFAEVQGFSARLTETQNSIPYSFYGNTSAIMAGLNIGLQF